MKRPRYTVTLSLLFAVILSGTVTGQRFGVPNMPTYDTDLFHFGFVLGANQSLVILRPIDNLQHKVWDSTYVPDILPLPDSAVLYSVESRPTPGFVISIVSDMRMGNYFNLRFIPSLSFGDRDLLYSILVMRDGDSTLVSVTKRVPSTYINFPLEVKYRAVRYGNFRPYLMGGAQYTLDLASQAKKRERRSGAEKIVKFNSNDVYLEAGVGFDLYNEWFKFGVELKMMYGMMDVLKRENNIYTNSIANLKSKIFQVSFTFE